MLKGLKLENSIKKLLSELRLIDKKSLEIFSTKTRDRADITVMRDSSSGVIFLDNFLPEDRVYKEGKYRLEGSNLFGKRDYEITTDVRRRLKDYQQFYVGKKIVDFGCGEGSFLSGVQGMSTESIGIEIEKSYVQNLNDIGIPCYKNMSDLRDREINTIFCFHTLEHLKQPVEVLSMFKKALSTKGNLIIEVPHANDLLLRHLKSKEFKDFTLWSQHLILHTRTSLERFLHAAGFTNFIIQGKQRYKLSNHLNWLSSGKPGGHKNILSSLDTDELTNAYERSLQMVDATDTLVAIVTTEQ